jgi:uncharacterized protein YrrD
MFHRHKWKVSSAKAFKLTDVHTKVSLGLVTDVLFICECGAVKAKEIDGGWTVEQLRGENK